MAWTTCHSVGASLSKLQQYAANSRLTRFVKRKLLPLSKEAVDSMTMQYHTVLIALQARQGRDTPS